MAIIDTDKLVEEYKTKQQQVAALQQQKQAVSAPVEAAKASAKATIEAVKPQIQQLLEMNKQLAAAKLSLAVTARKMKALDVKVI